jgi:hypothetical protein
MKPLLSMRLALSEPNIFGDILAGDTWKNWRILMVAMMGEPLINDEEKEIYEKLTGRVYVPGQRCDEFFAIMGRRSGKTRAAAVIAAYLATFVDYSSVLAPGERTSLPILSATIWQSKKAFQYLDGIFHHVPALSKLVRNQTSDTISLSTRVDIECRPASYRSIRSGTFCACLCDELAFWRDDTSANPDTLILQAVRPSLITTNGPLICISSPFAMRGELWEAYKRDYGPNGDPRVIIAKAASRTMNPGLSQKFIDRAFARDPISAASEYGRETVEFRSDVEAAFDLRAVEGTVLRGIYEIPHVIGETYVAFCDPAGGTGGDSFTLGIATTRMEGETKIAQLVCLREFKPPFSPQQTIAEISKTIMSYGINTVTGDRYAGDFAPEHFRNNGIIYEVSEKTKSDIYRDAIPLVNAGQVELLDNPRLITQICSLERRVARGGRASIDHPQGPNYHDDLSNAAFGALVLASGLSPDGFSLEMYLRAYHPDYPTLYEERAMRKGQEEQRKREEAEQQTTQADLLAPIDEEDSPNSDSLLTIDESPPQKPDHRAPCDVRLLQQ